MRIVFIILICIAPCMAYAQSEFPVSCENVTEIKIVRMETKYWDLDSEDGFFYALIIELTDAAGLELMRLHNSIPSRQMKYRDKTYSRTDLAITTNATVIQSVIPHWDGFSKESVILTKRRRQEAFDAAKAVCPALVPENILIDGQWWP